jgi:hypothetical protein
VPARFAEAARLAEQAAAIAQTGGDLADASIQLGLAASGYPLVGDASMAVPLAREALTLALQIGDPALIASGQLAVGAAVAETDPDRASRLPTRESRAQHGARLSKRPRPGLGRRDRIPP